MQKKLISHFLVYFVCPNGYPINHSKKFIFLDANNSTTLAQEMYTKFVISLEAVVSEVKNFTLTIICSSNPNVPMSSTLAPTNKSVTVYLLLRNQVCELLDKFDFVDV